MDKIIKIDTEKERLKSMQVNKQLRFPIQMLLHYKTIMIQYNYE